MRLGQVLYHLGLLPSTNSAAQMPRGGIEMPGTLRLATDHAGGQPGNQNDVVRDQQ
jgi:hypothetical protein